MKDAELIHAIRAGDRELYSILMDRHGHMVDQLCHRMTGNRAKAEELAHDAFVEGYLKLDQLQDPEKFRPWLRQLTLNLCRMWYRGQRWELVELSEDTGSEEAGEESDDDIHMQMALGLSRLSGLHRLVLVLHYFERLSYDGIARFLDIPIGTVMSRLHRARRALKSIIDTLETNPADEEMTMTPDEQFKRGIHAEIQVLLEMFREQPNATGRLRLILEQSPERLTHFIQQTDNTALLDQMAMLLPNLGGPAVDMVLASYFSADPQASTNARRILMRTMADSEAIRHQMWDTMASIDAYILLDTLIQFQTAPRVKAELLIDLMGACEDKCIGALLISCLLCFPDEAFDLLMDQFHEVASPEELHQTPHLLYALCRMGTLFCSALIEPLQSRDDREVSLALAGVEGVARAIDYGYQMEYVSPIHLANDVRIGTRRNMLSPIRKEDIDTAVYGRMIQQTASLLAHQSADIRDSALRILGRLRAEEYLERINPCMDHPESSTRRAAIMALAGIGNSESAEQLIRASQEDSVAERCAAIEALGRMKVQESLPLLKRFVDEPDGRIQKVAVTALGEIGGDDVGTFLQDLLHSKHVKLRKIAARALYSGTAWPTPLDATKERLQRVRGDAHPFTLLSLDAVMRYALPEIRQYDERELTRRISGVCYDYSATRRHLMEEGLMSRANGICEFTDHGKVVWQVEHFIMENYLGPASKGAYTAKLG
ncbi:MAG: sigma-70 family RNA polymerase sigma factor [Desulfobacterales bacterium]